MQILISIYVNKLNQNTFRYLGKLHKRTCAFHTRFYIKLYYSRKMVPINLKFFLIFAHKKIFMQLAIQLYTCLTTWLSHNLHLSCHNG